MEIGSFIQLEFPENHEFYNGEVNIARLNSGRSAIYHALRLYGCSIVYLPVYQCETVYKFLMRNNISIRFYNIDSNFDPIVDCIEENACILIVNYYGIMKLEKMRKIANQYKRVIIDNSQAFFAKHIEGTYSIYSARKFIGVPDGGYVVGQGAERFIEEYESSYSSDTSIFLLQRIEYGCEGKAYENRILNENRIDHENVKKMSVLTRKILDGSDYEKIMQKRRENFESAIELFGTINELKIDSYYDAECIPMVYPFLVEDEMLLERLLAAKHFQGRWWQYILNRKDANLFEKKLSKFMIPITIDQRYGLVELEYIRSKI